MNPDSNAAGRAIATGRPQSSLMTTAADKPAAWRRWLAIGLRCAHLAGMVLLGAALYGAPLELRLGAGMTLLSGIGLLAAECSDERIRLTELAGIVALLKLGVVGWMMLDRGAAPVLFWVVLLVSGLVSHAPREWRHWRPGW
jgi:hypothetical protein